MEDSGYIARVAFVMDKLLRKIGLSGKSIVPLLIGFGCTVPAVMATRTLTSENDDLVDAVYELYGQITDICVFCQRVLPGARRPDHDGALSVWHCYGNLGSLPIPSNII